MKSCSRCNKTLLSTFKTCEECREYNKRYRDSIPRSYKQGQCSSQDGLTKVCSDCHISKNLDEFYKHKRYKDGYRNQCVICHSKRWKHYYTCGYNTVLRQKLQTDEVYKIKQNQRAYLHQHLKKQGSKKDLGTMEYLGCSSQMLKDWLSSQFTNQMTWGHKTWQIDHVIPVSLFDLGNDDEQKLAFHWTNLQPLEKSENQSKYNKFIAHQYCNSIINACIFIREKRLDDSEYNIIRKRLQWVKQKISLQHFQIVGTPLES
jgi:hypothetical protein